jgi:hypothetical protein
MMRNSFAVAALWAVAVFATTVTGAHGQATNSGDIRGTVSDPSGAVVPDVTVTVTNLDTGVVKVLKTNGAGLFDTNSIVVGRYSVNFERAGFEKFSRPTISLQVGISTVNAILKVGTTSDTVTVNTDLPLLDTEASTQQTTFDAQSMQQLPNVGQDWENFAILIPGSAGLRGNTNPGQLISANGNLPYSNILSDGASTTLGTSQNSDVNIFETVQEVQISTSTTSAQYGIGGIIFNQVTKGGTNQFHGSAYDYFQSSEFNANGNYIFPHGSARPIARYRYNNFGGSIGGPMLIPHTGLAHKAFFYFNYDRIINNGTAQGLNDIPTPAVMAGDFSSYVNSQTGQPILLYDPSTQTVGIDANGNTYAIRKTFLSEYGKNAIPAALFDKVAANFQKFYPTPTNHIAGGEFLPGVTDGEGIVHKNFFAQVPVQSPSKRWTGRIDYDTGPRNRVTFSMVQGDAPGFSPNQVTASPIGYGSTDVTRLNMQVTDVLTINHNLQNEARFGFTYQGNFFADLSYGGNYPAQLGLQYAKANEVPGVQFYQNYPYAWIQPSSNQFIYKENIFDPSDVVTYIKGKHVMHFGGEVGIYRNDNTPYNSIQPGTFGFQGNYTSQYTVNGGAGQRNYSTGADYADFLLGYVNNWSASVSQEYGARLKNPQVFFQDDYKLRPNLTLNLGLRYQIRMGITEVHGDVGTYDPTVTNTANGQLGAFWYGATHANGRTGLEQNKYSTVLPRVGFAYLPNPTMTVRGGFGVYAYNLSLDTYGSGLGDVSTASGNGSDQSNGTLPYTTFQGTGVTNQGPTGTAAGAGAALPYAPPGTSPTRFNGQTVAYQAYNTPDPKIYQWNLGIQQAIGSNMVFELSYVASHAFDLVFQTDINQVPIADNIYNNQKYRPNQNYQQINGSTNDGISNYNSLQAQINRRLVRGLSFAMNYTWSKFLDNQDSSGWGSRSGPIARQYQTAAQNYGPSNFDIRNQFKARVVYDLPVGKGRMFFNHNTLIDEVFGGFQVSTTLQLSSGNPFSVFSPTSDGSEPGSSPNPFPDYSGQPLYPAHRTVTEWFNPAAFEIPTSSNSFGNVPRNALIGPGYQMVDLSAGKKFNIHENVKLQLRLDATNALNHPNFSIGNTILGLPPTTAPGTVFSQAGFGTTNQISSLDSARSLQAGFRLEF